MQSLCEPRNGHGGLEGGEVEMIVTTFSAVRKPGVDVVGPIPSEIQFYNRFSGGVLAGAAQPAAAASFVKSPAILALSTSALSVSAHFGGALCASTRSTLTQPEARAAAISTIGMRDMAQ